MAKWRRQTLRHHPEVSRRQGRRIKSSRGQKFNTTSQRQAQYTGALVACCSGSCLFKFGWIGICNTHNALLSLLVLQRRFALPMICVHDSLLLLLLLLLLCVFGGKDTCGWVECLVLACAKAHSLAHLRLFETSLCAVPISPCHAQVYCQFPRAPCLQLTVCALVWRVLV